MTTGVVRSLRTAAGAAQAEQGLLELGVSNNADVRCACLDANDLGGEKLGTGDRQLPLINWSEPRHCDMQEGSAIRPWAGPPTPSCSGRTTCSSRPPRNEAPCRLSLLTSHCRPASRGAFWPEEAHREKCKSCETWLRANATGAQNAFLASQADYQKRSAECKLRLLFSVDVVVGGGARPPSQRPMVLPKLNAGWGSRLAMPCEDVAEERRDETKSGMAALRGRRVATLASAKVQPPPACL